jgi:hypothetical protein
MENFNGILQQQHLTIESGVKSFIQDLNSKYYLKLDEKAFSPVIQISAFLVLKYLDILTKTKDKELLPFFFSFPDKKSASVWLTICLLTNFFNEDYIESEGQSVYELEVGKKYLVYGSIGKYSGIVNVKNKERFKFKFEDCEALLNKTIRSNIKNVDQSKPLNNIKHYNKNKEKAKQNRTPLSKILEPDEGVIINDQVLVSKVLLVAGRGKTTSIKNLIDTCAVYDEPISKVFAPNNNIILKPDLQEYKGFFENNHKEQIHRFIEWIGRILEDSTVDNNITKPLRKIKSTIEQDEVITCEIDDSFKNIVEQYTDTEPRLLKLMEEYPGISAEFPEDLKAVIINDINQIEDYPITIKGFLDKHIPVIVVTNRMIEKSSDLLFFKRLFDSENGIWKDAYRINWNRSKLNPLINATSPDSDFMDNPLWETCRRYVKQIIKIDIFQEPDGFNLDEKIWQLVQNIKHLQGFEYLKTSFFQYLNPLLYAFKNSHFIDVNNPVKVLIEKFKEEWENSKNYLANNTELVDEIVAVLKQLESGEFKNSKPHYTQNVFSGILSIPDYGQLNIPVGSKNYQPEQQTEKIIFTGFPYNEYSGKYLYNTCLNYFVPKIDILCWPLEGERTYSYLRRRIESGYFFDKLPEDTGFPEELILNNQAKIENEINETLIKDKKIEIKERVDFQTEDDLIALDNFQYEKYKYSEQASDKYKYIVKCNIVRFNDGYFMFLPTQSSVLSEIENESGRISIRNLKFNELTVGLRVFVFSKDQLNYSDIIQNNEEIEKANSDLAIWHATLSKLLDQFGSTQELNQYLVKIANTNKIPSANPDIINLRRWLYDEDLIAPNGNNLRIIFIAGKEKNFIKDNIEDITLRTLKAYSYINSAHIKLGHKIKSAIANKLESSSYKGSDFTITVNNLNINIFAKQIQELQTNDILIEYHETRKFLC